MSEPLNLGSEIISWNRYLKYLGANFISGGKNLKPDSDKITSSFFVACNSVLSNASHCNEILHINLQETLLCATYFIIRVSRTQFHLCAI